MLGAVAARRALVGALAALQPACVSLEGPCTLAVDPDQLELTCEAGGHAWVLAPAHTVEAVSETTKGASRRP